MQRNSTAYTFLFAVAVCVCCSIFVAGAAVMLKDKQQANVVFDRQLKILGVTGILNPAEPITPDEAEALFDKYIKRHYVDLETGELADDEAPDEYDPVKAAKSEEYGLQAPANPAGVAYMPRYGEIYHVVNDAGEIEQIVLQVWGQGLWSTLYGYLALQEDTNTIRGLTFYEHAETPGLGGEVDNPKWKAQWKGREAYNEYGEPVIDLAKGGAGPVESDPHRVDALSGATITGNGVKNLLNFWLSEEAYGEYLERFRQERGIEPFKERAA
jgi:Na+-transporting NADH:ubiquinone oxidoreductase subunit C